MKKANVFVALAIVSSLFIFCCGGGSGGGGSSGNPSGTLLGPDGSVVTELDAASPVAAQFASLSANTQYTVKTLDPSGNAVCEADVYTDNSGSIPSSPYCYIRDNDTAAFAANGRVDAMVVGNNEITGVFSLGKDITTGDYQLVVYDSSGDEVLSKSVDGFGKVPLVKAFPITSAAARTCASNSAGLCARSFLKDSSNVYATIEEGSGVAEGTVVDIYVISDRCNLGYASGAALQDVSPDGANTGVTVSYTGGLFTTATAVWASPANTGIYDVVVDVDRSATYTSGDLVEILDQQPADTASTNGLCAAGFAVQTAFTQDTDYIANIAMDRQRGYQDVFSKARNEDIYAQLQPDRRSWYHAWVYKYVVAHQDTWTDGDTLTDVIPATLDAVQYGCTNEGLRLIAPINLLSPGCYDVVFDANGNNIYDKGIDVVDNIDLSGATTCGFIVADDAISVAIDSIKDVGGTEVKDGTSTSTSSKVTVTGTASSFSDSATVKAYAVHGSQQGGAISGSIVSGMFTISEVPLLSGANEVKVVISEGTTYGSASADVTWNPGGSSGDIDIMAVITWLSSTDMDTHFIKTSGTYTGRSPGSGNLTDCTWDNCTQAGNEAINWTTAAGTQTTSDDTTTGAIARMDRDCIGCDAKTETVWIQDASGVVAKAGNFLLCVVAYSGTDTPSAQVSVNGVAQTPLTAPSSIDSSTGNDMWFVGYISQDSSANLTWHAVNEVGVGAAVCTQP